MTRAPETEVSLGRGWWTGDRWEQRIFFRLPDDYAEESLLDRIDGMLPVERDTALIANLVVDPGGNAIGAARTCELSAGDRELLLLSLRRRMFGNAMPCLLQCPACDERMDLDLKVDDLIVQPRGEPQLQYDDVIEVDGERFRVTFHLPTGGDIEKAVREAPSNPARAARSLAENCIDAVAEESALTGPGPEEWPESLVAEVAARVEGLDPQAEIKMQMTCPGCGHSFEQCMDTGGYLAQELAARQRVKYQEVHQLARAYHWSEADILRMGPRKRQLYLELLAADHE